MKYLSKCVMAGIHHSDSAPARYSALVNNLHGAVSCEGEPAIFNAVSSDARMESRVRLVLCHLQAPRPQMVGAFCCTKRGRQRTKTVALTFTSRARIVHLNTQLRCLGSAAAVVLPSFSQSDDRS
jgi:hypothetical protein